VAYREFFASEEVDRLFHELIVDPLVMSEIMLLLREKPFSAGEISTTLGLNSSEASRYLNRSSRQGFIRFDEKQKRFVPARSEKAGAR
jgi:Fic family protein